MNDAAIPLQSAGPVQAARNRRTSRYVAVPLVLVLVFTLADEPRLGPLEEEWQWPGVPEVEGVEVAPVPSANRPEPGGADLVVGKAPPVEGPDGGTELVTLEEGWAPAGDLPIRLRALANAGAVPERLRVRLADRAETVAAGVDGLLLEVAAVGDADDTSVAVEVDYSGFRHAYGGDWASRLQLAELEDCDGVEECGEQEVLPSSNDLEAGLLEAKVPLAGGGPTMLMMSGGSSGDNGDYQATSLAPASTWQVSQQTGGFSWSYPLRVVPGVRGPEPSLAFGYSSQAVDGRTVNTNTQGSWIGDGWDLWPGFVERSYKPCADDMDPVGGQNPNNSFETGDQCWFSDNATMSLNGGATELVKDGANTFRPVNDDGSRVERLFDTSLGNGTYNGEYWKVTTTDGMQYFFGRHRRQGFPTDTAATKSTWTAPVYGNHPGEPCYDSGDFSGSRCTQAWRWNLDYIVDPHGNTMTLFYERETGAYGRELDEDLRTTYHRGGYLARIEYGTRAGSEHTDPVPARVVFTVANRCLPGETCTTSNPSVWPDTPWDQYCDAAPCTDQLSLTFWTQKRLDLVEAQVWRGSSFETVESWQLRHDYLDAGAQDGEGVPMWLAGITRTGHVTAAGGSVVSDPEIVFDPGNSPLSNRVNTPSDGKSSLKRFRIDKIFTESGGLVNVVYSPQECTGTSLPTPHTNTKRCFPQWYAPGGQTPELDWFHKYVVDAVLVEDLTGASIDRLETYYEYLDDPAWHYDDSELVPEDKRTWSQWRGYSQVRVVSGDPLETQSAVEYLYMRGMDGDRASPSGGTKSVDITDSQSVSITDHEAHAGFLREEIVLDGPGGTWVSGTIHTPWREGPTATAGPLEAWLTNTEEVRTRTVLAGSGVRWTRTTTTFDTTYGMPLEVEDTGEEAVTGDETCTRHEYARNTSLWMVNRVSATESVGVDCAATPTYPDDLLSDMRTFYDDPNIYGAPPTAGLAVKDQVADSWSGGSPVWVTTATREFDVHGRLVAVADALDRESSTVFTPATGGPVTEVEVTNPVGHVAATVVEPAWGAAVHVTGVNGRVTEVSYDGLGRLTEVWLPGRDAATQTPNLEVEYLLRDDAPSAVTTRELLPTGVDYYTTVTLYDGFLRERQVQAQATGGGRVLSDTVYDSRGLVAWVSKPFYDTSNDPPDTTLVGPGAVPQIPGVIEYVYDGVGRPTDEIFLADGAEVWRTVYAYGGDRTHVTPPDGGTATTSIVDVFGQTVALRQYHGPTPAGTFDETTYEYTLRGELESVVDAAGNVWSYEYDLRGRQVSADDPDAGVITSTFDVAGQVLTTTDGRGETLGFTYDDLGRRTSVRDDSPTGVLRAEWEYDTLPGGLGKLTKSVRHDGGEQYETLVLGYDNAGRPTGTRTVIPSAETGLAGTYDTTVTYNPDGSVATMSYPAAGDLGWEELVYGYNDIGQQTWISSGLSVYTGTVVFNTLGELVQRRLGNFGKRTNVVYSYDEPTGRLTTMSATPELQPEALDLEYSYDDAGNVVRIADSPGWQRRTTPSASGMTTCVG